MRQNGDRSGDRFTVAEASGRLGITAEAVRQRIKRGTLPHERENGTVWVLLDADRSRPDGQPHGDGTHDRSELVEVLRAQVEDLRGRLDRETEANRENRRIIAGLIERVPEIEAPTVPDRAPGRPETDDDGPDRGKPPTEAGGSQRRPWWRRIFD